MDSYDNEAWQQISEPPPLANLRGEELALVHRHWMWANQQREWFYKLLGARPDDAPFNADMYLAEPPGGSMLVWYALLWSVIEALRNDRGVELRGELGREIHNIGEVLRQCRNAVLHVPRDGRYFDKRITALLGHPDSVGRIVRIHRALGRLLLEEMRSRS